jgi:acid phosphatase family membrane protein YuiD
MLPFIQVILSVLFVVRIMKVMLKVPRPNNQLPCDPFRIGDVYGMPSGHVAVAVGAAFTLTKSVAVAVAAGMLVAYERVVVWHCHTWFQCFIGAIVGGGISILSAH